MSGSDMPKPTRWEWFITEIMPNISKWDGWNGCEVRDCPTEKWKKWALCYRWFLCKWIMKSQTSVKIEFNYEIRNESGDLLTTGYSMLVFVDMKTGRPIVPPAEIKAIIEKYAYGL